MNTQESQKVYRYLKMNILSKVCAFGFPGAPTKRKPPRKFVVYLLPLRVRRGSVEEHKLLTTTLPAFFTPSLIQSE